MTYAEYADYEIAYKEGTDNLSSVSLGACSGCEDCRDTYDYDDEAEEFQTNAEPGFSKATCDVCGSTQAGDRYPLHGVGDNEDIEHLDVCDDCAYYTEYGCLGDTTMDELDEGTT